MKQVDKLTQTLTQQFLIATSEITSGIFHDAVILLCEHNDDGAFGLIINKPSNHKLGEVFVDLDLPTGGQSAGKPVYQGGPLGVERGFIVHTGGQRWEHTIALGKNIFLTTSQAILDDMAIDLGPRQSLVALGYASWASGQLEQELRDNAWLSVPISRKILFQTPADERYSQLQKQLGIDLNLITTTKSLQ